MMFATVRRAESRHELNEAQRGTLGAQATGEPTAEQLRLAACRAAMNDMGAMAREVEWLWPTR
jgi:hypothetical protein